MVLKEAFEQVFRLRGSSQSQLARAMGVTQQSINHRVNRTDSCRISSAVEMMDALGYEVVFTPKGTKLPPDAVIVTNEKSASE